MGNIASLCGEDLFKKITEEYGEDFIKLILAEKSKNIVKEEFLRLKTIADNRCDQFEGKVDALVTNKLESLNFTFESAKSSIDSKLPGGIATIERMKGESVKEFSGFTKLEGKVNEVKASTLQKTRQKRNQVTGDLQQKKMELIGKIEKERPKVPIYEEIPQPMKLQLLKKGEKQFQKQITNNKDKIESEIAQNFLPESFRFLSQFLEGINPESFLQDLVGKAFGILKQNMLGSAGNGIFGKIF